MAERKDVQRTRKAVLQAYLDLASERTMNEITASDIIKRASISRATFYAHYSDMKELQDSVENDFVAMTITANLSSIRTIKETTYNSVRMLLAYSKKNAKMICALSGNGTSEGFFLKFKQALEEELTIVEGDVSHKQVLEVLMFSIASLIVDNCRVVALGGRDQVSLDIRAKIITALIGKALQ